MTTQEQIDALKTVFPDVAATEIGEVTVYMIEKLPLADGAEPKVVTGLLWPREREGYPSRLFLSHKVTHKGKGQNWNPKESVVILDRPWWAVSWKTTQPNQTLLEMVLDHLGAFRP